MRGEEPVLVVPGQRFSTAEDIPQTVARDEIFSVQDVAQHRGDELKDRDAMSPYGIDQIVRVPMAAGLREDDGSAGYERKEEFPHRRIERIGRLLQNAIAGGECVLSAHPQKNV